jgi:hypothetical protein
MNQTELRSLLTRTQRYSARRFRAYWLLFLIPFWLSPLAKGVIFEWDRSPEAEVTGYKLYCGTVSGNYTHVYDAGNATEISVPGLISTLTYYVAVTAYNSAGLESEPSEEIVVTVPEPPDLSISNVDKDGLPEGAVVPQEPGRISAVIESNAVSEGTCSFLITAAATVAVSIEVSPDLTNWVTLGTVLNPTGALRITDTAALGANQFYRGVEVPVP